jgi:hypothetical protein
MEQVLAEADIQFARKEIIAEIDKRKLDGTAGGTQALGGVWEIILLQAIIPFLVSLTSSILSEVIKGKMLASISRRQAEQIVAELVAQPLEPKEELDDECLTELQRVLNPVGLNDSEIKQLYKSIKRGVEQRNQASSSNT